MVIYLRAFKSRRKDQSNLRPHGTKNQKRTKKTKNKNRVAQKKTGPGDSP